MYIISTLKFSFNQIKYDGCTYTQHENINLIFMLVIDSQQTSLLPAWKISLLLGLRNTDGQKNKNCRKIYIYVNYE